MDTCAYCERPIMSRIGELRIKRLEATRIGYCCESDIIIENKVFCDADCLCAALREDEYIAEKAP